MDFGRSFTYIFEDTEWLSKLIIVVALTFATGPLMLFFLAGLVPLTILLGYMVDIVANVRDSKTTPLPVWSDYNGYLAKGLPVMTAMIVYNLPLILVSCCAWILPRTFTDEMAVSFFTLSNLCCILPFIAIYTAVSWTLLAVGMIHYAQNGQGSAFYQVGVLSETAREMGTITLRWLLMSIGVNILLTLIYLVPCIGWLAGAALSIPVHGHLIGQYARAIQRYRRKKAGAV